MFAGPENNNFTLTENSPAIDADNTIFLDLEKFPTDLNGQKLLSGNVLDMGLLINR